VESAQGGRKSPGFACSSRSIHSPMKAALLSRRHFLRDPRKRTRPRSARSDATRNCSPRNFVSKEAYAQIRTNADTALQPWPRGAAPRSQRTLKCEYCTIRSPIDGVSRKIQIPMGNLVGPKKNDTLPLVASNQVHPIYVNFSVPRQQLRAVRGYSPRPLAVEALAPARIKSQPP